VITPETADWKIRGIAMSKDRQLRDMSLREEAKRLGIHPKELSDMEHGRCAPFDYDRFAQEATDGSTH